MSNPISDLQAEQLRVARETFQYYEEDHSRRAVRPSGSCSYFLEETGNRCAVGRLCPDVPVDILKEFDELGSIGSLWEEVYDKLPKPLIELGLDFLVVLQIFHDDGVYWYSTEKAREYRQEYKDEIEERIQRGDFLPTV